MPAIGGIGVDDDAVMKYPYLPAYVVLHEPSQEDIWASSKMRSIFLNQPLEAWEHAAVEKFRSLLKKDMKIDDNQELPRWILPHVSRLLQQCKYRPEQALKIWPQLFEERVARLPIEFQDVRAALALGFLYFHGRDHRCRPLLTIRIGRSGPLWGQPDLVKLVFLYCMEFALRYLLVPGRVENWSVLIDCAGVENLPSLWKGKDLAHAIATALGKVYSGRMAWTKIVNFPRGFAYRALKLFVEGIISALGKSDKVSISSSCDGVDLADKVELGQLEAAFGGTAPDLAPEDTFPFRMFSLPEGYTADSSTRERCETDFSVTNGAPLSMHLMTDLQFHEGMLLAECLDEATDWKRKVRELPLPTRVAERLDVPPVENISDWCERMAQAVELKRDASAGAVEEIASQAESIVVTDRAPACAGEQVREEHVEDKPAQMLSEPLCTDQPQVSSYSKAVDFAGALDEIDATNNPDVDVALPVLSHDNSRERFVHVESDAGKGHCLCSLNCFAH